MSKSLVVVVLCLVVLSPAQANFLTGTPPTEGFRGRPEVLWAIDVRHPQTGVPEMGETYEGELMTYHPSQPVEQGGIVVMRALPVAMERGVRRLTIDRAGATIIELLFFDDPSREPKVVRGGEIAHLVNPPGWERGKVGNVFADKDADEERWARMMVEEIARRGWKFVVACGSPTFIFINTAKLAIGAELLNVSIRQTGENPWPATASMTFVVCRAADLDSGEELDMSDQPYEPRPRTRSSALASWEALEYLASGVGYCSLEADLSQVAQFECDGRYALPPFVLVAMDATGRIIGANCQLEIDGQITPADSRGQMAKLVRPGVLVTPVVNGVRYDPVRTGAYGVWYPVVLR